MKKTIIKVFLIIGALVLGLLCWMIFFGDNGAFQSIYAAMANQVNNTWQNLTGGDSVLIPETIGDTDSDTNGTTSMADEVTEK